MSDKDFREFEKLAKNYDRKIILEVRTRNNDYHNAESIVRLDISSHQYLISLRI